MTSFHSFSSGRMGRSRTLRSPYLGSRLGSTPILATKPIPLSWESPSSLRLFFALSLMSEGSSPRALSIMARNTRLLMFQPMDWPLSSGLPPMTVKLCRNLRRACVPSAIVNSQSSIRTSLPGVLEGFSKLWSMDDAPSAPPGRTCITTLAKVPSGMSSEAR